MLTILAPRLIDRRHTMVQVAISLAKVEVFPCFFATLNAVDAIDGLHEVLGRC